MMMLPAFEYDQREISTVPRLQWKPHGMSGSTGRTGWDVRDYHVLKDG